jgi:hypothetical protein
LQSLQVFGAFLANDGLEVLDYGGHGHECSQVPLSLQVFLDLDEHLGLAVPKVALAMKDTPAELMAGPTSFEVGKQVGFQLGWSLDLVPALHCVVAQ